MRRWIAVVVVVMALAGGVKAHADDASRKAKAQELFVTLRMDRTMGQLMDTIVKQVNQMTQSMPGANLMTESDKRQLAEFQQRVAALVEKSMGWKELEPDIVELYANTYSEEELDGLLAFYKSPLGQTMLDKTPELMTKSTEITQRKMREVQPELNKMLEDFMKQYMSEHAKPATKPSAGHAGRSSS